MKLIKTRDIEDSSIKIPGSKSISHRAMICACLSNGRSLIKNILKSDDLFYTIAGLEEMGAVIKEKENNTFEVYGFNGKPGLCDREIYLGNSGTSMRLLAGTASLGETTYVLTGDERMCQRPMGGLISALKMAGIDAASIHGNDCPPVRINGKMKKGGKIILDCSRTSQYLSSVLIMGALLEHGLDIELPGLPVSSPYIDLTIDIMKKFNVKAEKINALNYHVSGHQVYQGKEFIVEPDLSNASYFWAAGAVTGKRIKVENIHKNSLQGDLRFLDILEQMGCRIVYHADGISVAGKNSSKGDLKGVDVDMSDIPDVVPTLAVVASFARGETMIRNIAHLREKECDRIDAVVSQLTKIGIKAKQGRNFLSVTGGAMSGGIIETFNDHRIAMAFSIAGLKVPGIIIENEECVGKSFPTFWEVFDAL